MESNAQVVLDVIQAVQDRDAETLDRLYHDDLEFHEAQSLPYGGVLKGKNVLREQLESEPEKTWLGTWDPLQPTEAERRFDPRVVAVNGDEVVVRYTTRGVSPSGERFESEVLALYEVRDGKFARRPGATETLIAVRRPVRGRSPDSRTPASPTRTAPRCSCLRGGR